MEELLLWMRVLASVLWVPRMVPTRRTIPASLAASAAMTTTTAKYDDDNDDDDAVRNGNKIQGGGNACSG
jgi:hypothetical protein